MLQKVILAVRGKRVAKEIIHRFPRLLRDYPDARLTKNQKVAIKLAENRIPRGYDRITKKQKKLARLVINGSTVKDACKKLGMDTNTFYRYMHYHPLFKRYYLKYAHRVAEEVEGRLDAKLGRAIQIVEEAMDNPDYYFAYNAAEKFLHGRGVYKKNVETKKQINTAAKIHGRVEVVGKPLDKELMGAFIEALTGKALSAKRVEPKVIKARVVEKVLEQLPAPAETVEEKVAV